MSKYQVKTKKAKKNCLCREGVSEVELAVNYSVFSQKNITDLTWF